MAQGASKLKKQPRKPKPVRGDQQKLRKGKFQLKARPNTKSATEQQTQQRISKMIVKRIEQTMATRAATDGAGLAIITDEGGEKVGAKRQRPVGPVAGSKRKRH